MDDAVLVSSTSLTDDAFNRKIEIDILIHWLVLARQLKRHLDKMIGVDVGCVALAGL